MCVLQGKDEKVTEEGEAGHGLEGRQRLIQGQGRETQKRVLFIRTLWSLF